MFDQVGEVSEGAHRNIFFLRVFGITIDLGDMWHNHLTVCLGTECSRLEQRKLKPSTSLVDILSSFNIVDSIDNACRIIRLVRRRCFFWGERTWLDHKRMV